MNNFKVLMNGIVKENPTFVLLLGMCPTLYGYGTGYYVCADLFKRGNLSD